MMRRWDEQAEFKAPFGLPTFFDATYTKRYECLWGKTSIGGHEIGFYLFAYSTAIEFIEVLLTRAYRRGGTASIRYIKGIVVRPRVTGVCHVPISANLFDFIIFTFFLRRISLIRPAFTGPVFRLILSNCALHKNPSLLHDTRNRPMAALRRWLDFIIQKRISLTVVHVRYIGILCGSYIIWRERHDFGF